MVGWLVGWMDGNSVSSRRYGIEIDESANSDANERVCYRTVDCL